MRRHERGRCGMTTWIAVAALVLAGLSVALFVLAIRRLLSRQANVTETMLRRYDDRLAGFAQVLNDALATLQSSRPVATLELEEDPEPMVRALELARERTSADGAIALVTGGKGTPIVATVGPVGVGDQPHRTDGLSGLPRRPGDRGRVRRRHRGTRGRGARQGRPRDAAPARGRGAEPARGPDAGRVATLQRGGRRRSRGARRQGAPADLARAEPARPGRRPGARHAHRPPRPPVVPRCARAGAPPGPPRALSARAARDRRRPAHVAERADRDRRRGRRPTRAGEPPPVGDAPSRTMHSGSAAAASRSSGRARRAETRRSCSRRSATSSLRIRSGTPARSPCRAGSRSSRCATTWIRSSPAPRRRSPRRSALAADRSSSRARPRVARRPPALSIKWTRGKSSSKADAPGPKGRYSEA